MPIIPLRSLLFSVPIDSTSADVKHSAFMRPFVNPLRPQCFTSNVITRAMAIYIVYAPHAIMGILMLVVYKCYES